MGYARGQGGHSFSGPTSLLLPRQNRTWLPTVTLASLRRLQRPGALLVRLVDLGARGTPAAGKAAS
jgi:hypothetical protein